MSEIPVHSRPRRLADWLNPTGARKVHSLIDKVYQRKNLEMAWERVKANRGSGGVDGQSLEAFAGQPDEQLERLQQELKEDTYQPQPVRQAPIPKVGGKPGERRILGIPTVRDRVCQQALLNRLEPIFESVFDDANFGYRRGRSTKDAMRKVWKEIQSGRESIVDADLKDFFGSLDHEKLLTLVAQRIADGRVLRLIREMLKAGSYGQGRLFPTERGAPQGGVVSPLLSNIFLTPFDREMRGKGYQLTRWADDWVITLASRRQRRGQRWLRPVKSWNGLACNCIRARRESCTSRTDSSFSATKSSAGEGCGFRRTRFVAVQKRERFTRIRARNRFDVSWTRCVRAPDGVYRSRPKS
jgi:RNA-directed DNA polymerase